MAVIDLINGKRVTVGPEKATVIWKILKGQIKPTPQQEKFCLTVSRIFLNWRNKNTPDDYILEHEDVIKQICKNGWMCDRYGSPTRPEFSDKRSWYLAKKFNWLSNA